MVKITRFFMAGLIVVCIVIPACDKNETVCEPSVQLFVEKFRQGVFPSESFSKCTDATLEEVNPSSNYGSASNLLIGDITDSDLHAVIRFDIAGMLPASVVVERAFLTLYCFDLTGSLSFEAHRVTAAWIEADVTWTNRNDFFPWNIPGGDYTHEIAGTGTASEGFTIIDIQLSTVLVKNWIFNPDENLGIILIPVGATPENIYATFGSSQYSNVDLRPMLTVVYSIQ